MALRSLIVMLKKALPRRMPGSGAFVPKGNPCSESSARLTDPTKYGLVDDKVLPKNYDSLLREWIIHSREQTRKYVRAENKMAALTGIILLGNFGHLHYMDHQKNRGLRASNA